MRNIIKFWIFVILWAILSVLFINLVNAEEMLVEPSISLERNVASPGGLSALFSELGIKYPTRANPCFDLEEYTEKYCTVRSIRDLIEGSGFTDTEFLKRGLNLKDPCEQIALYIGRVCYQENFKKIYKHFHRVK